MERTWKKSGKNEQMCGGGGDDDGLRDDGRTTAAAVWVVDGQTLECMKEFVSRCALRRECTKVQG